MELDKDLQARQEARCLAKKAEQAQVRLSNMTQAQLDAIVEAVAKAFYDAAGELAEMAAKETGFGNPRDKTVKNQFASRTVCDAVRDMKTVGVLKEDPKEKLWEVGVPVGVIAAIVPSTNPTSTVCYKSIIALKAGNTIVFSPHPKAIGCTLKAAQIVARAAEAAGAPPQAVRVRQSRAASAARKQNFIGYPPCVEWKYHTGNRQRMQGDGSAFSSASPAPGRISEERPRALL